MKVSLNYSENLHFIGTARHFDNIHIDEPEAFSGTNLAPSSLEYLLIGIGGCIGSSFIYCLQKNEILLEKLKIVVDGKLKHTSPKMTLEIVTIDVEIIFIPRNGQKEEKIDFCKKIFKDYCPALKIIRSPVPLNIKFF
jgi:uncharacterized OsmC-like protein